ncbi:hypothetical protein BDK92_1020 [Micromonospora pisi]|uniref:Uncharacterized protein n=1 Tax=Micromonospora pisi TaxID=589240 RepID=A0A495JEF3_9ACTN|nr:hypothetical protein [Micromonospora pisi]RKR86754.1 hypothetical protein BDK92_1020 [Micromonospora pisi]
MQDTRARTLSFPVSGLPPIRTQALSIFSAGDRQATRVRALLEAACVAAQRSGWTPLTDPVELDLVVRCPPGHHGTDAATLLGGVSAVLQDKRRVTDIGLTHLGPLIDVALYVDDRQIRQMSYREEPADSTSYLVRVAALPATG